MNIKVLDCTLRDGGYVNDWCFGDANAKKIVAATSGSGADIVELGFIRNCSYEQNKLQFSDMSEVSRLFRPSNAKLAIMVEIGYGYDVESFPEHDQSTADLIRIIIWKRMINEGLEYCRRLKEKGYLVSIQATRTDQYTLDEFAALVRDFSAAGADYLYIVDTFGLMDMSMLLSYARVADSNSAGNVCIGYHAHNNMQQAFTNAVAFVRQDWRHDIIVDASIMGIGRGAGNLCLELLYKYLNEQLGFKFEPNKLYSVVDECIMPIFRETPWGYSIPYYLSASNGCNPTYVGAAMKKGLSVVQLDKVFAWMRENRLGIRFDEDNLDAAIKEVL